MSTKRQKIQKKKPKQILEEKNIITELKNSVEQLNSGFNQVEKNQ